MVNSKWLNSNLYFRSRCLSVFTLCNPWSTKNLKVKMTPLFFLPIKPSAFNSWAVFFSAIVPLKVILQHLFLFSHKLQQWGFVITFSSFVQLVPDWPSPGQQHSECSIIQRNQFNWMSWACAFLGGFIIALLPKRLCLVTSFGPTDCGWCKLWGY